MNSKIEGFLKPLSAIRFLVKKPLTIKVPFEPKAPSDNYRGIHSNDKDCCVGCGNCAKICPTEAIKMVKQDIKPKPGSTDLRPQVDYGRCCSCGLCVDVCPTGSLKLSASYLKISPKREDFVFVPDESNYEGKGYTSDVNYILLTLDSVDFVDERPYLERNKDFLWELLGFREPEARIEALRCMGCGICVQNCPAEMDIPEYLDAISKAQDEEALKLFYRTNPLPEICGIVCTHRCENNCVLGIRGEPIQIKYEKGFAASKFNNYEKIIAPSIKENGKKVAIIGGGASGLAAAYYLRLNGFNVHIFEAYKKLGGMMRYGIPRYRLPEDIIDKEIKFIISMGVKVRLNTKVGSDIKLEKLLKDYDAVYLATGFHKGMMMGIPGEEATGVIEAVKMLRDVNGGKSVKIGKKVVVIGGGDVAMDASRTALRLGAQEVIIMYRRREIDMPARVDEIEAAKKETIKIMPQALPIEIMKKGMKVSGVKYIKTRMVDQGPGKRPKPVPIEDKIYEMEIDTVIEAIGQRPDYSYLQKLLRDKLKLDSRGVRIVVDENGMTSVDGLYAGGDCVNHRGDIVSSVADAKKVAKAISKRFGITFKLF